MSIRKRLDPRRRRANGVDTHDVTAFRSVVNRTGFVRSSSRAVRSRSCSLPPLRLVIRRRPSAHSSRRAWRRRSRSLAQHHRRRLRADPADASAARRRRGVHRPRRLLGRAVRAPSPGTPAEELRPVLRLLVAPRLGPGRIRGRSRSVPARGSPSRSISPSRSSSATRWLRDRFSS